jgi:hypothetical protein
VTARDGVAELVVVLGVGRLEALADRLRIDERRHGGLTGVRHNAPAGMWKTDPARCRTIPGCRARR